MGGCLELLLQKPIRIQMLITACVFDSIGQLPRLRARVWKICGIPVEASEVGGRWQSQGHGAVADVSSLPPRISLRHSHRGTLATSVPISEHVNSSTLPMTRSVDNGR